MRAAHGRRVARASHRLVASRSAIRDRRRFRAAKRRRRGHFRAPVRVCAGGDVTLGTNLDPAVGAYRGGYARGGQFGLRPDPDSLAPTLKPFLADADVVLLNVEGAIGAGPAPQKCGPHSTNCFAFRQPPSAAARFVASRTAPSSSSATSRTITRTTPGDAGRDTTIA